MLKRIERDEVIDAVYQRKLVYLMVPANAATTLNALFTAAGYLVEVRDEEPFPAEPEQWTESEDDEDLEDEEDEQPDEDDEEIAEDPEEEDETEDEQDENEDEPEEEEDPEPEPDPQPEKSSGKRKAWHEKIVNWYMQGRQPEWIAQELGLNKNTVIYHLHKEGLK